MQLTNPPVHAGSYLLMRLLTLLSREAATAGGSLCRQGACLMFQGANKKRAELKLFDPPFYFRFQISDFRFLDYYLLFNFKLGVDRVVFSGAGFRGVSSCRGRFTVAFSVGVHRSAHRM